MGFLSKLFKKTSKDERDNKPILRSQECKALLELYEKMNSLLQKNAYIAKSEYLPIQNTSRPIIDYFNVLCRSGMLETYCCNNDVEEAIVNAAIDQYENFEVFVDNHNEEYIQNTMCTEKEYLDNILHDVDPVISLDEDQRRVVLTDEDYCLVIAGAGAGKTTTVAAKVKYLVERKYVDPSQILVVSFTNKAVQELRDKLNKDLHINCPVATFHSTGNAILRKQSPEKLNIVDQSTLYFVIQDYFKESILQNESLVNNLILFFASYFDAPFEGKDLNAFFNKIAKSNYATMRSDLNEFQCEVIDNRTKKAVTIQSEYMRSYQEVEIANFLYLNNIEYQYEPLYQYDIMFSRKPYTPDFLIKQGNHTAYIEHWPCPYNGVN